MTDALQPGDRVGDYAIDARLGEGSFGSVFTVTGARGERAALKVEPKAVARPLLPTEKSVYDLLAGKEGFPKVHAYFEAAGTGDRCLVMDRLGPNLQELLVQSGGKMSLRQVLIIGVKILKRVAHLHALGLCHRDIKPQNFTIGGGKDGQIYAIDFGLAKPWRSGRSGAHHPATASATKGGGVTGTPRFAAIWQHEGFHHPARRDDVESLIFLLVYLLKGRLPWQGLAPPLPADAKTASERKRAREDRVWRRKRNEMIYAAKKMISVEELCEGVPKCITSTLAMVRGLAFAERPPYETILGLWIDNYKRLG